MTKPLISVIVPVHNAERYIARCMESILAQDYENYEIVAVVDNSDDASLGILKAYQKADKRVKITEKKIGNPGGARNAGLDNAKGDLIMFVDADDALYDDALSYLCGVLEKTKSDVVIGAYSGEEILEQPKKEKKVLDAHDAKIDMMYQKISSAPWAKLYRASVIGKTRFPKYMMAEDALFNYAVFSAAKKIVVEFEENGLAKGLAAISVDGKMVDTPVYLNALDIVNRQKEIDAKNADREQAQQ